MNTDAASSNLGRRHFSAIAGVFLSRCSGLLRAIIVNAMLGANTTMDAFNTAFRFPNSLRDLFADGALSSAFMKVLVDAHAQNKKAERELIAIVLGFFITITVILAILAACASPAFINLMSNTRFQESGGTQLASQLFQLLIFYLPLTMLNAVMMAILGVRGDTFRAMNGSIFLSVGMIAGVLSAPLLRQHQILPIWGLAWGAMLGAVLQLIYQSYPLLQKKVLPRPNFNPYRWLHFAPLREILILIAPRAIGQGAATLSLMVNTFFALHISAGAMTYVATTIIIIQVPIGLFGVATGFAALPVLTANLQKGELSTFSRLLTESLDTSCWLATCTSLTFVVMIVPIYVVMFQHGAIQFHDTILNCLTICAYASGILFSAGSKVLLNTLYALNSTRLIVINSFAYLLLNTLFSYLLTPAMGLIGLGLAFGLASAGNFWLNYYFIWRVYRSRHEGLSPYDAGGKYYTATYLMLSVSVIILAWAGSWLTQHVWATLPMVSHFLYSLMLDIIMGSILFSAFILVTYFVGPAPLKKALRKLYSHK